MTQWKYTNDENRYVINELDEIENINSPLIQEWVAEGNIITPATPNIEIMARIIELEESIGFNRKQREAIINDRIIAVDSQIAELRLLLEGA
jgi:Tfp pilus assembly ATPase PilU